MRSIVTSKNQRWPRLIWPTLYKEVIFFTNLRLLRDIMETDLGVLKCEHQQDWSHYLPHRRLRLLSNIKADPYFLSHKTSCESSLHRRRTWSRTAPTPAHRVSGASDLYVLRARCSRFHLSLTDTRTQWVISFSAYA